MTKSIIRTALTLALVCAGLGHAQSTTGTTTLSVTVGPEASLAVGTGTVLRSVGSSFASYSGTTNLTYRIRTIISGMITLRVTTDFSPQGGPSVAAPPTPGDTLTYACAVSPPGTNGSVTACIAGTQASSGTATGVATFGPDARSLTNGNTGTVNWTLSNDPAYKAGAYSATVTFTISAS